METVSESGYWTITELINEKTLKLMDWVFYQKNNQLRRHVFGRGFTVDDVIQEAAIILIKAKMSRNLSHTTYVCKSVYYASLKLARERKEHTIQHFNIDNWDKPVESHSNEVENRLSVDTLLTRVSDRERFVLDRRFRDGISLDGVAKDMGISRDRVRQLEQRAIEKMAEV